MLTCVPVKYVQSFPQPHSRPHVWRVCFCEKHNRTIQFCHSSKTAPKKGPKIQLDDFYLHLDLCCTKTITHWRSQLSRLFIERHIAGCPSFFPPQLCVREANRENETETRCARVCIAVNIARELSYAPKAAPAIWPPRLPSPHLLLTLSISLLHTLTHMLRVRDCVCVCVDLCVCRWCFGSRW